jgi:hypothetical protein
LPAFNRRGRRGGWRALLDGEVGQRHHGGASGAENEERQNTYPDI